MLAAYLRHADAGPGKDKCDLVASDRRLVRAAKEEGLWSLDPESISPEEAAAIAARSS